MLRPSEIVDGQKARAAALRLTNKELAALADLDETTVGRTFNGDTNPLLGTLDRIETALASEERRVRQHLEKIERSRGSRQSDLLERL
jgi:predicted transcriptional regulator